MRDHNFSSQQKNRPDNNSTNGVPPTQFLMLSLFLLLLAFFIAMTAGAEFDDEKKFPVIDSLERVFPVNKLRGENLPATAQDQQNVSGPGQARDAYDSLFLSESFPFEQRLSREQGNFIVTMAEQDVEELLSLRDAIVVTPRQKQEFFAQLAGLIHPTDAQKPRHQLHIITTSRDTPTRLVNSDPEKFNSFVRRAERYALAFQAAGIRPEYITTGIEQGASETTTRLIFVPQNDGGEDE